MKIYNHPDYDRYTEGDCWILALALAKLNPSCQVLVLDGESGGHAALYNPNTRKVLDIGGVSTLRSFRRYWKSEVEYERTLYFDLTQAQKFFRKTCWGSPFTRRPNYRKALRVAQKLMTIHSSRFFA